MPHELPIECDITCDEWVMDIVIDALEAARLEQLIVAGLEREQAYEFAQRERDKREEAFRSGEYYLSILGTLVLRDKHGKQREELRLIPFEDQTSSLKPARAHNPIQE